MPQLKFYDVVPILTLLSGPQMSPEIIMLERRWVAVSAWMLLAQLASIGCKNKKSTPLPVAPPKVSTTPPSLADEYLNQDDNVQPPYGPEPDVTTPAPTAEDPVPPAPPPTPNAKTSAASSAPAELSLLIADGPAQGATAPYQTASIILSSTQSPVAVNYWRVWACSAENPSQCAPSQQVPVRIYRSGQLFYPALAGSAQLQIYAAACTLDGATERCTAPQEPKILSAPLQPRNPEAAQQMAIYHQKSDQLFRSCVQSLSGRFSSAVQPAIEQSLAAYKDAGGVPGSPVPADVRLAANATTNLARACIDMSDTGTAYANTAASQGLSGGAIAGITVGSLLGVVALSYGLYRADREWKFLPDRLKNLFKSKAAETNININTTETTHFETSTDSRKMVDEETLKANTLAVAEAYARQNEIADLDSFKNNVEIFLNSKREEEASEALNKLKDSIDNKRGADANPAKVLLDFKVFLVQIKFDIDKKTNDQEKTIIEKLLASNDYWIKFFTGKIRTAAITDKTQIFIENNNTALLEVYKHNSKETNTTIDTAQIIRVLHLQGGDTQPTAVSQALATALSTFGSHHRVVLLIAEMEQALQRFELIIGR